MYDIEIERIIKEIKENKHKSILLHFPDGLKQSAHTITEKLKNSIKGNINIYIWFGTNYGSCDIPLHLKNYDIDAIFTFGHSPFVKQNRW